MKSFSKLAISAVRAHRQSASIQAQRFSTASHLRVRQTGQSPEEIEKAKHEQMKKQDQGKGEWHEELASSSESHVKADQENVKDHDQHIENLQQETANKAEQEK